MTKFNFRKVGAAAAALAISASLFNGVHSGYHYVSHTRPILQAEAAVQAASDQKNKQLWSANSVDSVAAQIQADLQTAEGLYTIRWGDTLWAISQATGVSAQDLAKANGIANPHFIVEGWIIEVRPELIAELLASGQTFARTKDHIDRSGQNRLMISEPSQSVPLVSNGLNSPAENSLTAEFKPLQSENVMTGSVVNKDSQSELAVEDDSVPEGKDSAHSQLNQPDQASLDSGHDKPSSDSEADLDINDGQSQELSGKEDQLDIRPNTSGQVDQDNYVESDQDTEITAESTEDGELEHEQELEKENNLTTSKQEGPSHIDDSSSHEEQIVKTETVEEELENTTAPSTGDDVLPEGQGQSEELVSENTEIIESGDETPEPLPESPSPAEEGSESTEQPADELTPASKPKKEVRHYSRKFNIKAGVQYVPDPNLAKGETKVLEEGIDGSRLLVVEQSYQDGEFLGEVIIKDETEPAKDYKIAVGTKEEEQTQKITKTVKETVKTPLPSRYIDDPNLEQGQEQVLEEGANRIEEISYEESYINGELQSRIEVGRQLHQEGSPRLIARGTKVEPEISKDSDKEIIRTPNTEVERRPNEEMDKGEERLLQQATDKVEEVSYEVVYIDGIEFSREEIDRKVLTPGQKTIIEFGTKEVQDKIDQKELDLANQAQRLVHVAQQYIGMTRGSDDHKAMIDRYNKVRPRPVNYAVSYTDDWCDAFVTAVADEAGVSHLTGRECGVERHKNIFKQKGIWNQLRNSNNTFQPQAGDIVVFDWKGGRYNGWADHIGIVESVSANKIYTIEGNTSINGQSQVGRKIYHKYADVIQGYARPEYNQSSSPDTQLSSIAKQVIQGQWGTGNDRIQRLTNAGYNYQAVQNEVNRFLGY